MSTPMGPGGGPAGAPRPGVERGRGLMSLGLGLMAVGGVLMLYGLVRFGIEVARGVFGSDPMTDPSWSAGVGDSILPTLGVALLGFVLNFVGTLCGGMGAFRSARRSGMTGGSRRRPDGSYAPLPNAGGRVPCQRCRSLNPAGSSFCGSCGAAI